MATRMVLWTACEFNTAKSSNVDRTIVLFSVCYLPIESLHFVLEKVPPPLGVQRKGRRNAMSTSKSNTLITNIIMNLHTNVHSTPYSSTSIESFEVLVALAARKFDEKATLLPKNAIGIRARKCCAGWTCALVFSIDKYLI